MNMFRFFVGCGIVGCIGIGFFLYNLDTEKPEMILTVNHKEPTLRNIVIHARISDDRALDSFLSYDIDGVVQGAQFGILATDVHTASVDIPFSMLTELQLKQLKTQALIRIGVTAKDRAGNITHKGIQIDRQFFAE